MTAAQLIASVCAIESVDELDLYDWWRPKMDLLRDEFYQCGWPTADFPIWLRSRYLARKVAA